MTYADAVTLRDAIEAQLLTGAGVASVQIGDRQITYQSTADATRVLNRLNRDIAAYDKRTSNLNPTVMKPRWK